MRDIELKGGAGGREEERRRREEGGPGSRAQHPKSTTSTSFSLHPSLSVAYTACSIESPPSFRSQLHPFPYLSRSES